MDQQTTEHDVLRLDVTPKQAAALHGAFMLYQIQHFPPSDTALLFQAVRHIPEWERQANLGAYGSEDAIDMPKIAAALGAYANHHNL